MEKVLERNGKIVQIIEKNDKYYVNFICTDSLENYYNGYQDVYKRCTMKKDRMELYGIETLEELIDYYE